MQTTVALLSFTKDPIETVYKIWEESRKRECLPIEDLVSIRKAERDNTEGIKENIDQTFLKILNDDIPVVENISFTFLLRNVSIALREQLVRHRIGVVRAGNLAVDIIPGEQESSFWSQSMRVLNMGSFAKEEGYEIPEEIKNNPKILEDYKKHMEQIEFFYNQLMIEYKIPAETARLVIPLAAQHDISWTLNLKALKHILHKRGCWILQLGLWKPIIEGVTKELVEKVDPIFKTLIAPPCVKDGCYRDCQYKTDNIQRYDGKDPLPPCSIFLLKETSLFQCPKEKEELFFKMKKMYEDLWGFSSEQV